MAGASSPSRRINFSPLSATHRGRGRIGRIYERDGLAAAFADIETRLLPLFLVQEKRRARQRH